MAELQTATHPWTMLGGERITSLRLTQQYYIWRNQLGFLIHPKVELNVEPEQLRIAELGTASGIWLLDLANKLQLPVKLDGFGVDVSLAPPPQWLPQTVTIQAVDDFTSHLPEDLVQAYDIVHVVNQAPSIKNNDPGPVIKHVMRMLKPGGYIQWLEADTAHRRIMKSNPALPATHLEALMRYMEELENNRGPRGWIDSLPDILARYGLEVPAVQHRHQMPDAYAKLETDRCLLGFEEFSRVLDSEGSADGEKLRKMLGLAADECTRNGQGIRVDMVVGIAKKEG